MVRKLLAAALALMLLSSAAFAEGSILPDLTPPETQDSILPQIDLLMAVSFGVEMNVYPALTRYTESGRWQECYTNVTLSQYNAFGVILGQRGYTTSNVRSEGTVVALSLVKDKMQIEFVYDYSQKTLSMTYPEGVTTAIDTVAPQSVGDHVSNMVDTLGSTLDTMVSEFIPQYDADDPFGDHQEIALGTEMLLNNAEGANLLTHVKMRVTPNAVYLNKPVQLCTENSSGQYTATGESSAIWFDASVTNIASGSSCPDYLNRSLFRTTGVYLHYITPDDHYIYNSVVGLDLGDGRVSVGYDAVIALTMSDYTQPYSISSLETMDFAFCFENVPNAVVNSTDGILAITFTPTEGDKYVLYLRK